MRSIRYNLNKNICQALVTRYYYVSVDIKEGELFEIDKILSLLRIALGEYCHSSADSTARFLY